MNSWTRGLSILGLSTLSLFALTACETGEDRTMASAQSCLDGARDAAAAQRCVDIVQGLTTQDAYMVRCSAAFIANGFSGQKIADAYLSLNNNSGSTTDPMVGLMAYLNFTEPNFTATSAVSNCSMSGVRSMWQLASAADLASTIQSIATQPFSYTDSSNVVHNIPAIDVSSGDSVIIMQNAVNWFETYKDDLSEAAPQNLQQVGQIANVANAAFCVGVTNQNADICPTLQNAISAGSGDLAAIGLELMNLLR